MTDKVKDAINILIDEGYEIILHQTSPTFTKFRRLCKKQHKKPEKIIWNFLKAYIRKYANTDKH